MASPQVLDVALREIFVPKERGSLAKRETSPIASVNEGILLQISKVVQNLQNQNASLQREVKRLRDANLFRESDDVVYEPVRQGFEKSSHHKSPSYKEFIKPID